MSTTPFTFGISFSPQGTWNIPANTATVVPASEWICTSDSDPNQAAIDGKATMVDSSGNLTLPDNHKYLVTLQYDLGNDFGYTNSNAAVSLVYTPKNASSTSQTYSMATAEGLANTLRNTVIGNQGDTVSVEWTLPAALNAAANENGCNTRLTILDLTGDTESLYYFSAAGSPPQLGTQQANYLMQTANITNGQATFLLTQDGTANGQSIFTVGISKCSVNVQAVGTNSTTLTPPSGCYLLPYPANLSTITAVFSSQGDPTVTWKATAQVSGL